jgi:hypothetical protein
LSFFFFSKTENIIEFLAPGTVAAQTCIYREDSVERKSFMDVCKPNLGCRSDSELYNTTFESPKGEKIDFCCCEPKTDTPGGNGTTLLEAQVCQFDEFGNVNLFTLMVHGPDLKCKDSENMMTYKMDLDGTEKEYACCWPKDETTVMTTSTTIAISSKL